MPIVPMTGKPKDSLYPEPEEQKIEINPLSYLNTPDTATEAEFAVAVDELAKMSPFGIRETGDYSQFGADNAKDAFFNLRKAILHGIESLSDDESRAWFETDPEDIETRYRIASENLPPSQKMSLAAGTAMASGRPDVPFGKEYDAAPDEIKAAADRLRESTPVVELVAGEFYGAVGDFDITNIPPERQQDYQSILQWRDRQEKERTISAYDARINAKNTLRKWAMMKPLLSDEADSLLQHIMADKPRDDEFDAKFMALPEEQQEVVMMLGRDLRNTPDKNMLRDSMTEFMIGGMRLFGDAAKEVRDLWMLAETDREDFQKQAEVKARMAELWAPKRSQEYGYWEDAILGVAGSLPYTGFTALTSIAGVPEVGLGVISLSMAHRFKQQIALQGGDVTDPKVLVLAFGMGIAHWGIEQAQIRTWMKSMTDLERRMATATFVKNLIPSIYKAEARAKVRQVGPKLLRDNTADLLKEWLFEEENQDLLEEGFVSWGIGEDVARNMAEQAVESLHQNFGTMLLMTGGFSSIGAARTGLSRKHTDQELYDAMHHRAQLVGSLHQRTELREKLRKGEDIDRRQLAKLEKDIDYQRRVLSTFHRAFNKAGGMEDAESAFQRMGLDPRQSFLAAYMFDQERRSIMGDPDLTQAEKEELIGKQATSLSMLKQEYPNRTFTENPDGTFTSSFTINGNEVREIHQTGTIEYDPASPEGATSTVNAINAAEKAARLSGAPFSDNMKGMTVERWLNLAPEARDEIVQALDIRPEGNFIFTAKMAGSPDVAQVDEKQIRHLSGEITLAPDADQTAAFHEGLHAFLRYLREIGDLTPQDVQKLREEFGDPRKGVNEDFNEEAAAETIRKMQSRSVRHVESTGAEAIMDKVFDVLDRIDLFRRRRKQAETVAENLLGQMRRGEWTGIPVGTITEAQRQKNAQMRKKSRAKPKKQAKKPQEPIAPTQRPTVHRVFHGGSPIQSSNKNALRATDKTKAYRLTGQPQIDDIIATGEVRAKEGKMRGGKFGEVHWSAGDDLLNYSPQDGKYVIETNIDSLHQKQGGLPISGVTRIWRGENGKWVDITDGIKQAKKPQEPTAKKPEQAQEPPEAEITPQGEGQSAEEAAAAAEADEIGAGETGEVDADQPLGKGEWRAVTPKGNVYVRGEWVVVDMDDLKTSDQAGYDQSIQPRDRGTVRSRAQIHEIARTLNPAQLLDSARTDDGSPVMMPDGSVLSGNGRVMALREARDIGNIAKYEAVVRRRAAELGIAIPAEIKNPVLVRRMDSIEGPSTVQQVAELSNQPVILQRSEAEIAESDARAILDNGLLRLFQPGADGNVLSASNMDFINGLVQATGDASLVDSNNRPTEATRNRIRRALLALLVGGGENSREIVRGLVEDAKNLGMKTEVDGLLKAAADIVTVARDKPQYSLLNDIGLALRMYMDMKREGSSPFQADLFGRPEAVDMIVKALWGRSSIGSIAAIFSDYATRARLVDTSTGSLGLEKDPTKEVLLQKAIDSTGTGETVEQAQQKKAEEAAAESPEPPPPPPSEEAPAPTTVAEDQSVDEIPPPSNITIQPGQTPWDKIGKGWKALNTRVKDKYTKWSKSIPLFQGAKRGMSGMTTKAIRSAMSKASRDAVRTIWDGFGGSGGWGLYHALENFENADLISVGEYYAPRLNKIIFFHTKGDKAAEIIQSPKFAELRQRTIEAMVSKARTEDGQASLPDTEHLAGGQRALTSAGTLADRLKEIVEELYGPEMSEELTDLTAVLQAMADAAANGRQQAADTSSDMFDAIADIVVRDAAEIRKAAQAFEARGGKIQYRTEPDTYKAIANGEVTPGRETFALIDPPYYLTQDYDPDNPGKIVGIDTYRQTRDAIKRLTEQGNGILYTDSAWWLDHADHAEAGLVVPEDHQIVVDILNGMDHFDVANRKIGNRHEAIGVHHGRAVEQDGRGEGNGSAERILLGEDDGRLHQPGGTGSGQDADVPGMAEGTAGEAGTVRGGDGAGGSDQARLSVTAAALKRLNKEPYKEEAEEVIRALNRIPASLKPYVERYNDPDDLISLAQYEGWKRGPKVAPEHRSPYRPAVRLKDGRIAWHPRARMHSEALAMWLKQQDIPLDAFDIDEYYGDGGLGPDGRYYEKSYIGDGVSDFVEGRETGRFSVQARQPAPAFYSQLRRVIEQKVPNRATVAQVRATIDPAKGSGVKADEVFWSGLQEFLDGKKPTDMVTKEEVLAATREVVVRDVVKWQTQAELDMQEELTALARLGRDRTPEQDARYEQLARRLRIGKDLDNATKFEQYQLPGGENYREILLTLPPQGMEDKSGFGMWITQGPEAGQFVDNPDEGIRWVFQTRAEAQEMIDDMESGDSMEVRPIQQEREAGFRSSHFSEPNIVAHVRFNERTSADGKRTLFIEEIQSDWAQSGKKKGFNKKWSEDEIAKFTVTDYPHNDSFNVYDGEGNLLASPPRQFNKTAADALALIQKLARTGMLHGLDKVPPAPYVTKTDAWVSLALKRMVRLAAENGFEQVAWTTGIQQVSRYEESMRKVVDRIEWTKPFPSGNRGVVAIKNGAEVLNADVDKDGKVTAASHGDAIGKQLGEVVGKTLAERIMSETRNGSAEGKDLTIGGEGMKGFYDQIVPTTANKLFKRFGAKVGEAWFDLGDPENAVAPPPDDMVDEGGFTAHALPITPEMRDSVLYEGQARFSVKANAPSSTAQDAEYMAAVERGDMETAQRIVDEAAKAAGYNVGPVWHWTDKKFEAFDPSRLGKNTEGNTNDKDALAMARGGFWFIDKDISKEMAAKIGMRIYLSMSNPKRWNGEFWDLGKNINKIKADGHDGVIVSDAEFGGTSYIAFSPSQIKSADAITRDDAGRIIPPSERFNPQRDDIRYSVKAYPNLYRDVLSKHPASDKLDGNKAWLTLDGKWINVDEHRDAVPFDDGIYADIGVREMAEAGLVRVHWVNFSSMPGGVMYAEHAPGQLTRAQRKELEDTAIERGGEVEYDHGQAWIRQPPPRYSVRVKAAAPAIPDSWKHATGDIVTGDTIRFKEAVFHGKYPKGRYAGDREIVAEVLNDSYGVAKQQHTFTIRVLSSTGIDPLDAGTQTTRKGRNIYKNGTERLEWVDENMRNIAADEKHQRGREARAARRDRKSGRYDQDGFPRYSVRARAPLFGNNNRAIASLAVQHLMGEKLDTERAEKAMYLFAASGTTPDQMIADAKKLAESKVAQEAKKHIENRDPNAAHRVMSQQAEYDSIVALRTGMKSGLKMGQEAERAKQSAEKKLLLNARGEDLQQFIIDTGIDWTETLLSSLPEAFAEWEKAREEAEKKAKEDGAPEGPQQVPEPPPADPAELEARDRRMRELVAATRAWGDAERAKREKEADDRRKKEQERIEKGESGEEADDTDADPGGEQAEGMEPEGLVIPKELLQAHGVDIRNAQEVAHLIRIWMADWLVRQSKGRLTHQTVWKDREAVEKYRKTMVAQLRDMANGMVEQGWAMTVIHNRISDIPSTARPDTIERRTASIVAMIQAHSIRQTRAQLITDIRKNIKKKAIKGKRHDALNEDLERKINSEQELTARYLRRILTWSPEKVDAEIVAIHARLKERTELYSEQNPDAKVALDVEFHRDLMRLRVLQEWGGLKRMLPAQIKQAGIAIDGWLVSAQERLYRRWWAMEEQIGKLVTALNEGIVPDDPEQARIQVSRISGWINDNIATVRQRLEGLIRQQHDPIKRQAAQAAIDEIMFILSRGTEIYRTVAHEYRQAFVEAVIDIAGGKNAATAYMKHLEEEIPIEVAEQVSRQGYNGRGGGRVMTYNQALQLYASITQRGYASNVKLHKREEHAALLESIFTTEDLALIVRLREIYEERRSRLSEVVQEVSGMLVWRPDPLYMPVRVKMPKKGGFQSKGDPSTWMPLARSLTPRVHHGLDFDEGATLTGTFYDATEDAARAIGFGTRGLILRGVLGNSTIQESADRYYGGGEMADINQQVVQALDGFGRTDQDSTHGMLRTIRELNAYAALSWHPLPALKQTVSFPVFAMVLDGGFGQVLSAIKDFDREALRDIMESDGFKARYEGGFMPEVAEILSDGRRNPIAQFYKLGMTTLQIGDFVPALMVAPGLYKARLAQNIDAGMDEATAKERAMTWTWEMIEAALQTSRAEMLPKFYRQTGAGSEAMKLILQFSSAPLLQLSHEYHAWRDAMAGVDGAWKRLGRAVLVNHIIIPLMLEMAEKMFYWLIGRDEPEDQQLFWTILNGVTIGAVNRIMIIGILAETAYNAIVDGKIRYGGQMVPAESLYRTAAYALRAFLHDPFDPEDGMDAFQSDIVKALEGMLAPFRYAKEFYDNRIAQ